MAQALVMTFSADTDIKSLVETWAKEDDRSVSYIIRKLIETEQVRRSKQLELIHSDFSPETPASQMRSAGVKEFLSP